MAKIEYSRNIILSLVNYLSPMLSNEGYSFTFVSNWLSDDQIVLPQDYDATKTQIILPAGKFTANTRSEGGFLEVGGNKIESLFFISLFLHAITEGQAYDLMDFLHDRIKSGENLDKVGKNVITIYDFTDVGYPSDSAPDLGELEIQSVRHRYIPDLGASNVALKHAGDITIVGLIYVK